MKVVFVSKSLFCSFHCKSVSSLRQIATVRSGFGFDSLDKCPNFKLRSVCKGYSRGYRLTSQYNLGDHNFSSIRSCAFIFKRSPPSRYAIPSTSKIQLQRCNKTQWDRGISTSQHLQQHHGDDNRGSRPQTQLLYIPNPFKWLKSKWYMYQLNTNVDPSFTLNDFLQGSRQALSHLTHLISTQSYNEMKDFATTEVVDALQGQLSQWSTEQISSIGLETSDVIVSYPYIYNLTQSDSSFILHIDVQFIALKMYKNAPLVLTTIIRFARHYEMGSASDWLITKVFPVNVKAGPPNPS